MSTESKLLIGVLAIQGAVEEHITAIKKLHANAKEVILIFVFDLNFTTNVEICIRLDYQLISPILMESYYQEV